MLEGGRLLLTKEKEQSMQEGPGVPGLSRKQVAECKIVSNADLTEEVVSVQMAGRRVKAGRADSKALVFS